MSITTVPFDVLALFFTYLVDDRGALYAACLTNRVFLEAAQESLYRRVLLHYRVNEDGKVGRLHGFIMFQRDTDRM